MKNRFALLILLIIATFSITACSSSNSSAPPDNQAHPLGWIASHAEEITTLASYNDCTGCHGANLTGSGDAVSCYSCHTYNNAIPFGVHPADWTNAVSDHRAYASANTAASCKGCHGQDLLGSAAAPSCFSASYGGISCHADGPGTAPHALDGSYLTYTNHGPDAKEDLTVCQNCHGELTPTGSSPRFNIGITRISDTGCEGCHNDYTAHPSVGTRDNAHWYGATVTHADSGNLEACTLCHGDNFEGNTDTGAPACLACHNADPVANNTGCVSCHSLPPNGAGVAGNSRPNRQGQHNRIGHTITISTDPEQTCSRCHNGAGIGTDNHFDTESPADINFLRPDTTDNIQAVWDGSNVTCTGVCHMVTDTVNSTYNHESEQWY